MRETLITVVFNATTSTFAVEVAASIVFGYGTPKWKD